MYIKNKFAVEVFNSIANDFKEDFVINFFFLILR